MYFDKWTPFNALSKKDTNEDGTVNVDDFVTIMVRKVTSLSSKEAYELALVCPRTS